MALSSGMLLLVNAQVWDFGNKGQTKTDTRMVLQEVALGYGGGVATPSTGGSGDSCGWFCKRFSPLTPHGLLNWHCHMGILVKIGLAATSVRNLYP